MKPNVATLRWPATLLFACTVLSSPALRAAQPEPTKAEPAKPAPAKIEETVELPKMAVKGEAICSYGIGLAAQREAGTRKIQRLFITAVADDSDAARLGLQPGDEILSINGHKVAGMDGSMKPGAELFDLVVDQHPGQTISVQVIVHSTRNLTLEVLPTVGPGPMVRRN